MNLCKAMNKIKKIIFILLSAYLFPIQAISQCEAILPLTDTAMQYIGDPYQLTFIHKQPINRLDSLVMQLVHPPMKIDSNYYDWNNTQGQIRPVYDVEKIIKINDSIGQLKTDEALCILSLPYMAWMDMRGDLTPMNSFVSIIRMYGGAVAINKHYLNNAISTKLALQEFEIELCKKTIDIRKKCLRNIKYCKPLTGDAWLLYSMQQVNPDYYDSEIKKILGKYIAHQSEAHRYQPDSIMIEILRLPFVRDADWDTELEKTIKSHTADKLGVIIDDEEKGYAIERVYTIEINLSGNAKYKNAEYGIRFLETTRQQREKEEARKIKRQKK